MDEESETPRNWSARDPRQSEKRKIIWEKQIREREGSISNPESQKKRLQKDENRICKAWENSLNFWEFKWEPGEAVSFEN